MPLCLHTHMSAVMRVCMRTRNLIRTGARPEGCHHRSSITTRTGTGCTGEVGRERASSKASGMESKFLCAECLVSFVCECRITTTAQVSRQLASPAAASLLPLAAYTACLTEVMWGCWLAVALLKASAPPSAHFSALHQPHGWCSTA